ncbi:hypothetical protein SO802_015095 [Lithocarpus litseifolius]|uniref:Reverse transcriptase domain-containing protein n=1 Tax=Lithocarpus litseifolius TaxID=425828 RepID=A0AAW2CV48_9ROSI
MGVWVEKSMSFEKKSMIYWKMKKLCGSKDQEFNASERRKKNTIVGLWDENGIWCDNKESIAAVAISYFKMLYTTSLPSRITEVTDTIPTRVTKRLITDNVLVAFELMHYLDHKKDVKDCFMAVKLDMSKAYDRVEWSFIEKVTERMGFHERWINLIMHCITIVSYSVLVNGVAYRSIVPSRGLRQGDPLSPYLFLLCADGFSSLIGDATRNKMLNGVSICRGCPMISHLFFADDSLLFCKTSRQECQKLIEVLELCEAASGQKISADKSSVFFSHNTPLDRWVDCPVNFNSVYLDVSDIALKILTEGTSKDLETFFVTACSLWYSRNQVVFEENIRTPNQVWIFAKRITQDYKEASNIFAYGKAAEEQKWSPPPPGMFKVNVDGATSGDGNPSCIRVIIRDNRGETIAALCMPLNGQYLSLETEVLALEKGVLLAKEMELEQIVLETDALTVVQCLLAGDKEGELGHLLKGISDILKTFSNWQIKHLNRDCNRVAHELAQLAKCTGAK